MGRIGRVVSFERRTRKGARLSELKLSVDAGNNITAEHFAPIGSDEFPLEGDYAISVKIPRSGGEVVVGYIDPKGLQKASKGDKRFYARGSDGDQVAELWIKNDGSIIGDNGSGYFELQSSGQFMSNGAKITTGGDVITSDGVSLRNHYHDQAVDSDGNSQAPTSAPLPTE